jgi:hypothetical protein
MRVNGGFPNSRRTGFGITAAITQLALAAACLLPPAAGVSSNELMTAKGIDFDLF